MKNSSNKTTIIGIAAAVFFAMEPILETGTFNIKRDWPKLVCAGFAALFGLLVKDADKTGLPQKTRKRSANRNIMLLSFSGVALWGMMLFVFFYCTGCSLLKRTVRHDQSTTVKDSSNGQTELLVNGQDSFSHTVDRTDSTVGVPGSNANMTLPPGAHDIDTTIKNGNATLHIYTDKNGNLKGECECDSLTIVVRKLTKENTYLRSHKDTVKGKTEYKDRKVIKTDVRTEYVQKGVPWWKNWLWYVLAFALGMLLRNLIIKLIKTFI